MTKLSSISPVQIRLSSHAWKYVSSAVCSFAQWNLAVEHRVTQARIKTFESLALLILQSQL